MSELMVQVSHQQYSNADEKGVELNGFHPIDVEFLEVEEFFESGEEPLDSGSFLVDLFECWWVAWCDPGSCGFDDWCHLVF